jgi:MOSC domain-containing protein YiiM
MELKELQSRMYKAGKVMWIGIRPQRREEMQVLSEVMANNESGLAGDRYKNAKGSRQVTLIQAEHIEAIRSILNQPSIDPGLLRRNIVVSGINLISLKEKKFKIGEALLEYSGECHPCSRMEENLGFGGYNAMRGHGGITARIINSGLIKIGDSVSIEMIE